MFQAYVPVIQIQTSVNQRLWSFLDQLAFVHKNKATGVSAWVIDVFNRAENELDFKINAHAHKKRGV